MLFDACFKSMYIIIKIIVINSSYTQAQLLSLQPLQNSRTLQKIFISSKQISRYTDFICIYCLIDLTCT